MDASIHVTKFKGVNKPQGKALRYSWDELVELFRAPGVYRTKESMPLFSFTKFKEDYRKTDNVELIHAIVVEHDGETLEPETAADIMREFGIESIIYTTPSHTVDKPRFRLIVRIATPVDGVEHNRFVRVLNHLLDGALAPECADTAREWYYGQIDGAEYQCISIDGLPFDQLLGMDIDEDERELEGVAKAAVNVPKRRQGDIDPLDAMFENVLANKEPDTVESAERIKSMLYAAAPHPDTLPDGKERTRDDWLRLIAAVHSTQISAAYDIALEWSQQGNRFIQENFDKDWNSFKVERQELAGLGTLHHRATGNGWIDPRKVINFDDELVSETSVGQKFAMLHRGKYIFVRATRTWMRWSGYKWESHDEDALLSVMHEMVRGIVDSTHKMKIERGNEVDKDNYRESLSIYRKNNRLRAALSSAAGMPWMCVKDPGAFDCDPMLLGVRNGVVNLRTGELLQATPAMMISKHACADYDPKAKCPEFLRFMDQIFMGDDELIGFIQRIYGYGLTGDTSETKFFFMIGEGSNGKSVLMMIMRKIGGDYAKTIGSELIVTNRNGNSNESDRCKVQLPGVRSAMINEIAVNATFNDEAVKKVTGSDAIEARFLTKEKFEFKPTHTLFLNGNHRPAVKDAGDAFWRRLVMIEFKRKFAEHEKIMGLEEILYAKEADGILNWMIQGCVDWQKGGLRIPKQVMAGVREYRESTDVLGDWVRAQCDLGDYKVDGVALYGNYMKYMESIKDTKHAIGIISFYRQLEGRGFKKRKTERGQEFDGIRLAEWGDEWGKADSDDDL